MKPHLIFLSKLVLLFCVCGCGGGELKIISKSPLAYWLFFLTIFKLPYFQLSLALLSLVCFRFLNCTVKVCTKDMAANGRYSKDKWSSEIVICHVHRTFWRFLFPLKFWAWLPYTCQISERDRGVCTSEFFTCVFLDFRNFKYLYIKVPFFLCVCL